VSADHERIWLQPRCDACRGDDRSWCQDNVWSEGCDPPDCANAPTEYVRADLVAPLRAETIKAQMEAIEANELLGAALLRIQTLRAENARLAWKPIDTVPQDRLVEVYAPSPDPARWHESVCDLPPVVCLAQWHPDAGFCVCTIREVTHWREHEPPTALDAKEPGHEYHTNG